MKSLKIFKSSIIALLLLVFITPSFSQSNPNAFEILQLMIQRANQVKTIEYNAIMNERIGKKMVKKESYFKINNSPLNIYVKQSFIGITLDALYCQGLNKNRLLIATVGFPWIQTSLDPLGNRVRANHHHTIFEAGFTFFVNITNEIVNQHKNDVELSIVSDNEIKDGRNCYKISINAKSFKFVPYTVGKGENLTTIAKRNNLNDYMILEKNPKIDDYLDVVTGQVINIPTMYGKQLVLFLDKDLLLPVEIDIFDDLGLYATYMYKNLKINKQFAWNEFSPTYNGYHFR